MLTFDQIAEQAKAYANFTSEHLEGVEKEVLHEQLSLRLVAQEEVSASKKALSDSANELLKRIKADVLCINSEIRRRHAAEKEGRRTGAEVLTLDALPEGSQFETLA